MRRLVCVLGVLAAAGTVLWAQTPQGRPQRDARVAATGAGTISGTVVTDEAMPQPVARVEVRALRSDAAPIITYTDPAGRFVFANLPTGRYTIQASKPGYVRTAYGARRYDRPGTPVTLSATELTQELQLRLARGGVITGRILDEFGQPSPGARVRAQIIRRVGGELTLSNPPLAGALFGEATDDRGVYRLYGLPAGDYVVSVTPRNSGWGDIRRMTGAEISAAERAVEDPASPVIADTQPATVGYTSLFYPGVLTADQAGVVTVKAGEERAGIDFSIQFVNTASIEGSVILPANVPPEAVQLLMLPRRTGASGPGLVNFDATNRRVGADGRFSYTGIKPGSYTISARVNPDAGPPLWANADVDIDGQNVTGVILQLQDGLTIQGRMVFDADGVDPPTLFSRARLNLVPANGGAMMINIGRSNTDITASGAVTIKGVIPGQYRMMATFNTPEANWILKSAVIKGRDAADVPFELAPGDVITDAVFTFTNRTQELTGTLQDASRRPAPDYTVVVFPADPALWGSSRRVRTTRPDTDGRFTVSGLPSGAYRIAAVVDIGQEELQDQALLEELAAASIPFTLADGETKVQDLRLAGGGGTRRP